MSLVDEIEKLDTLHQKGSLSDDEYQQAKTSLLREKEKREGILSNVNTWGMFIHFSQFIGYALPVVGMIVPVLLWQIKKNESEIIDRHGKVVVNWILTELILLTAFALLSIVLIGIPLLILTAVAGLIFPIIGGIKANDGIVWRYPLSIRFFKAD